jgi:hypothetical protein
MSVPEPADDLPTFVNPLRVPCFRQTMLHALGGGTFMGTPLHLPGNGCCSLLAAGCWLLLLLLLAITAAASSAGAAGCWLLAQLAPGCWLRAARCWLSAVGWLLAARCSLPAAARSLSAAVPAERDLCGHRLLAVLQDPQPRAGNQHRDEVLRVPGHHLVVRAAAARAAGRACLRVPALI